jgi:hypothetical protein
MLLCKLKTVIVGLERAAVGNILANKRTAVRELLDITHDGL